MGRTTVKDVLKSRGFLSAASCKPLPYTNGLCAPNCPECGGGGWVRYDVPLDDPRYGKMVACSHRDLDAEGYAEKCGLRKAERGLTWNHLLDIEGNNAVAAAGVARDVLRRGYGWVYLWGTWGVSKTMILQIAAAESLRVGYEAAYLRMDDALDYMRGGFSNGEYERRVDWLSQIKVLCIDEVEKINEKDGSNGWASTKRWTLFDKRYVGATRGESVTIFAGNADPSKFGGELWDRIQDGRFAVIHMTGDSIRPGMTWNDGLPVERESVFERNERASVFERGE